VTEDSYMRRGSLQATFQSLHGSRQHSRQNGISSTIDDVADNITTSQLVDCMGDEHFGGAREDFDIVYDIFYQDENFEPHEAFLNADDLQNALEEGFKDCEVPEEHSNSRAATPPLERANSPEVSARTTVKSLSRISVCRNTETNFASSQGLTRAQDGVEAEFPSFSRRDLGVRRKRLQELHVESCQKSCKEIHGGVDEIHEDLKLISDNVKEKEFFILKGREQLRTSSVLSCQEMLTQQERKLRPLSAARVSKPSSSSPLVLGYQQSAVDKAVGSSLTFMERDTARPSLVLEGAQLHENFMGESYVRKSRKCVIPELNVTQLFNPGNESGQASSYATPRTGISADEMESSVSRINVTSRYELHDNAEGSVLELLSAKVQMLDVDQQKYLLQVLNKIERAKKSGSLDIPFMFASLERPWSGVPQTSPEVEGASKTYVIVFRILSNWGDTQYVGLCEVSLAQAPELKSPYCGV
jgi:hypothetical protein